MRPTITGFSKSYRKVKRQWQGGRKAAVNPSPTRPYLPVILFHHKEPQGPYLTPISLIRSAATNKIKDKREVQRHKMACCSRPPSTCWPFITFLCKMTDKIPKTKKAEKTDDKFEERQRDKTGKIKSVYGLKHFIKGKACCWRRGIRRIQRSQGVWRD